VVVLELVEVEVVQLADGLPLGLAPSYLEVVDDLLQLLPLPPLVGQLRVQLLDLPEHFEEALLHPLLLPHALAQLLVLVVVLQPQFLDLEVALLQPRSQLRRFPIARAYLEGLAQLLNVAEDCPLRFWSFSQFLEVVVEVVQEGVLPELLLEGTGHVAIAVASARPVVDGQRAVLGGGGLQGEVVGWVLGLAQRLPLLPCPLPLLLLGTAVDHDLSVGLLPRVEVLCGRALFYLSFVFGDHLPNIGFVIGVNLRHNLLVDVAGGVAVGLAVFLLQGSLAGSWLAET
jgi:hypothetical protein